jgi:hypothetical protein
MGGEPTTTAWRTACGCQRAFCGGGFCPPLLRSSASCSLSLPRTVSLSLSLPLSLSLSLSRSPSPSLPLPHFSLSLPPHALSVGPASPAGRHEAYRQAASCLPVCVRVRACVCARARKLCGDFTVHAADGRRLVDDEGWVILMSFCLSDAGAMSLSLSLPPPLTVSHALRHPPSTPTCQPPPHSLTHPLPTFFTFSSRQLPSTHEQTRRSLGSTTSDRANTSIAPAPRLCIAH